MRSLFSLVCALPLLVACSSAEDVPWTDNLDASGDSALVDAGPTPDVVTDSFAPDVADSASDITDLDAPTDVVPDAPVSAPAVHYVGRHDDTTIPGVVRFGWPGTGLVVRFKGTSVGVQMDDPAQFFTVVVDGTVQERLDTQKGETSYVLASGLPDAEHVVELYRRTEGSYGPTKVSDVVVQGTLLAPPPVTKRMEVIGDSISCGYGNEGTAPCNFSADTENNYMTYESIAARAVGAEVSVIAWSGKGMVYNYGDNKVDPMPVIYPRTIPTSKSLTWDFGWQPDVVVIHLGTNDFSTDDDPTEQLYVDAYEAFLKQLRAHYASAWILCTIVPRSKPYTAEAVQRRHDDGDTKVKTIDLTKEQDGKGCNGHPGVASHERMAQILVTELHDTLGW